MERWYGYLVGNLSLGDYEVAVFSAGVMSHYIADVANPIHTDSSDAEDAIHSKYETDVSQHLSQITVGTPQLDSVVNATAYVVSTAQSSHKHYWALVNNSESGWNTHVENITATYLSLAIKATASLWASAIQLSGLQARAGTPVGGIIWSNTTWTPENSPYIITDTVQIPENVTLTINPGVVVTRPTAGDMFLLHGTIRAHGTIDNPVIFDGGGNSNFFSPKVSTAEAFLDLDYSVIRNGFSFWPATGYEQYGHFSLKHSELSNVTGYSYVWYPGKDIYVEYNRFINTAGFAIGHSDANVYIRYNLFVRNVGPVVSTFLTGAFVLTTLSLSATISALSIAGLAQKWRRAKR